MSSLKSGSIIKRVLKESDGFLYEYKMIRREGEWLVNFRIPLYSFAVKMTVLSTGEEFESIAEDVFGEQEAADAFFAKLTDNLATPLNLRYIVEDELLGDA